MFAGESEGDQVTHTVASSTLSTSLTPKVFRDMPDIPAVRLQPTQITSARSKIGYSRSWRASSSNCACWAPLLSNALHARVADLFALHHASKLTVSCRGGSGHLRGSANCPAYCRVFDLNTCCARHTHRRSATREANTRTRRLAGRYVRPAAVQRGQWPERGYVRITGRATEDRFDSQRRTVRSCQSRCIDRDPR